MLSFLKGLTLVGSVEGLNYTARLRSNNKYSIVFDGESKTIGPHSQLARRDAVPADTSPAHIYISMGVGRGDGNN